MIDISFITATRPNSHQFLPMMENIIESVSDLSNIEICIAYSPLEHQNLKLIKKHKNVMVNMELGGSNLFSYINSACKLSTGKLIWCIMDDFGIYTKDVDIELKDYIGLWETPYRIFFGGIHGSFINPIITRKWVDITGNYATGMTPLVWITRLAELLPARNTKTAIDVIVKDDAEMGIVPLRRTTYGTKRLKIEEFRKKEVLKEAWYEAQLEKEAKLLIDSIKTSVVDW